MAQTTAVAKLGDRATAAERVAKILAEIKPKAPEQAEALQKIFDGVLSRDLAILGEDEAFKLVDQSGDIKAYRKVVHLSADDGTLVQPVSYGPYVVSAQGYEKLVEGCGVVVIMPPQVLVEGEWKQNPYAEKNPKTSRMSLIHARAISFRFSGMGIPMVSDWTTIFDVGAYRLIDLLAKAKHFPQAFQLLPVGDVPAKNEEIEVGQGQNKTKIMGRWAEYPYDEYTSLWVCTSHPEAINFYSQIMNREKKALDFAQTFAKRNSVKHLLGVQRVPGQEKTINGEKKVSPIRDWSVPVTAWRPTSGSLIKWDLTRYAGVQKAIEGIAKGEKPSGFLLESTVIPEKNRLSGGENLSLDDPDLESLDGEGGEPGEEPIDVTPKNEGRAPDGDEPPPPTEETGKQSKRSTERPKDPLPPPEPPTTSATKEKPADPPSPSPETKKSPAQLSLEAFQKKFPDVYATSLKETGIAKPMTEEGFMKVYDKCREIMKRPKK